MPRNWHGRRGSTTPPSPQREEVEMGNPSSEGDQTTNEDYDIVYPKTPLPLVCCVVSNMLNTVH